MRLPDYLRQHISTETRFLTLSQAVTLESGEILKDVVVAYRTWGNFANAERRAVLICHALTGSADADAWWPGVIGQGAALDPDRDFIVCSNVLGSCYGTSGPVSEKTHQGNRFRADFPRVTVRDMVRVQAALLDHLGVTSLELVIGPSLGGMQVLEWAASYPQRVRSIAPVGACGRHSAWCIAASEAQRAAIVADRNWNAGYYEDDNGPDKGLAAARMIAMCSYRSWHNFEQRFSRRLQQDGNFEVQSYLRYQGDKLNERFDANSYLRLIEAMDSHDIARGRGVYADVLRSIHQPAMIVSVSSDVLYPPAEQAFLAECLPNAEYRILQSAHGHDGFLIDTCELAEMIAVFRGAQLAPLAASTVAKVPAGSLPR